MVLYLSVYDITIGIRRFLVSPLEMAITNHMVARRRSICDLSQGGRLSNYHMKIYATREC